jgi:hypothetical protein
MFGRFDILKQILKLDPKEDCQEITYLVGAYEHPWLTKKSLEFALFRTYAVPHTSRILAASGQFEKHGQKRYDDTTLMLAGIAEKGYDSDYGKTVIAKMNELHGRWNLKNEDMLYVLSTFIFEPIRWHNKYGWRKPTEHEKKTNYHFWCEVGKRMGIRDIPKTYEAYEQFNIAHERKCLATINLFLSWYPAFSRPLVFQVILSFFDEPLLNGMGFKKAPAILRFISHHVLKFISFSLRFMPPRKKPYLYTEIPTRTYPQDFKPEDLGARYEEATGN